MNGPFVENKRTDVATVTMIDAVGGDGGGAAPLPPISK